MNRNVRTTACEENNDNPRTFASITTGMSKTVIGAVALGVASLCFVGYYFYSDRKRRGDSNFESNQRKMTIKKQEQAAQMDQMDKTVSPEDMKVNQYIYQEGQIAQLYLQQGDTEQTVKHVLNAVSMFDEPIKAVETLRDLVSEPILEQVFKALSKNPTSFAESSSNGSGSADITENMSASEKWYDV